MRDREVGEDEDRKGGGSKMKYIHILILCS